MTHLAVARSSPAWDADAAVAEGDCRLRLGEPSAGIAAYEEALLLDPDRAEAAWRLAMAMHERGEGAEARRLVDWIAEQDNPRADVLPALAEAWFDRDRGGDAAWLSLAGLRRALDDAGRTNRAGPVEAWVIEGLLWLDEGDPIAASRAFGHAMAMARSPIRAISLRAEAIRRSGRPEEALALFEGKKAVGDLPIRGAVLARIHADLGRPDEARRILAETPDPADPDVIASRWYLARRSGDAARAEAAARAWREAAVGRASPLESLIPWDIP